MKIYAICFTICFSLAFIFVIPTEKFVAVQHITHDFVELKGDDNNQSDAP